VGKAYNAAVVQALEFLEAQLESIPWEGHPRSTHPFLVPDQQAVQMA